MLRGLLRVSNLTLISALIAAYVMHPIEDQALRDAAIGYDEFVECNQIYPTDVESKKLKSNDLTGLIGGVLATALGENRVVGSQNTG